MKRFVDIISNDIVVENNDDFSSKEFMNGFNKILSFVKADLDNAYVNNDLLNRLEQLEIYISDSRKKLRKSKGMIG